MIWTVIHRFYGSDEMLVLITYDVNTKDKTGEKRLRKVARICENYGQRVQNSVFECLLDSAQSKFIKAELLSVIDEDKDSLRFYYLGKQYESKIEHYGAKVSYRPEGTLIL